MDERERNPQCSAEAVGCHPGVAIPKGVNAKGSPTSIHLVGKLYGEADLLALAKAYQSKTDHHQRRPKLD